MKSILICLDQKDHLLCLEDGASDRHILVACFTREKEVKLDGLLQKIVLDYAVVAVVFIVLVFVECLL